MMSFFQVADNVFKKVILERELKQKVLKGEGIEAIINTISTMNMNEAIVLSVNESTAPVIDLEKCLVYK